MSNLIPAALRLDLEERSAVLEHDGGLSRWEADALAALEVFRLFRAGAYVEGGTYGHNDAGTNG